jgi:ABC-type antimicrobial peptide transport system permease subunit
MAPLTGAVRSTVAAIDRQVPVTDLRTMEQVLSRSLAPREFILVLLGAFAGLALILACVGTYGVIAYSTALRSREIGIRVALGSDKSGILRLVLSQGMRLAAMGIAFGVAGSWFLTRLLSSLLYGTGAYSPEALASAMVAVSAAALLASYIPARHAAGIDPAVTLRSE